MEVSFMDDRKVWQGDDGWFGRLKAPNRPLHWQPHPYEIDPKRCRECGTNAKAIMSRTWWSDMRSCLEQWVCKCWRINEVWRYKNIEKEWLRK